MFNRGLLGPGIELLPPYTQGIYEKDGARMIVTSGLGEQPLKLRVNNPRELSVIELRRA